MSHAREPPRKRVKLSASATKTSNTFSNVDDLQAGLSFSSSVDTLIKTLTILRNQFSLKHHEVLVSPSDSRLLLAQQWMGRSPGALDLFKLWEGIESRQYPNFSSSSNVILSLTLSVLSSLLSILSSHYTYHSYGFQVIKTLLTSQYTRKINSFIAGAHTDLILSSMKLLNSMSDFASGKERRNVLDSFHLDSKTFNRLLNMRRKGKNDTVDPLGRPDIRTLSILLICSFTSSTSAPSTKNLFFDQHSDKFLSIFKGLALDPYVVVRKFLELCWEGVWCDVKVPKKTKVGLFGEITLTHLLKLYNRVSDEAPDSPDEPQVTADLVHHFLLAICTRPGQGVCFRDRGWYPPSEEGASTEEEPIEGHRVGRGRVYNKILANILKSLKPNEDLRQQELTLRILEACPELIAGYWGPANLTLEPRLSSRWIANIALFRTIISLPTPAFTFFLSNATHNPTPPPLHTVIDNILPSAINTKTHFSKGLASQNGLVQLCTAQALCKCLIKYAQVRDAMKHVADSLEESADSFLASEEEEQGQWRKRLVDLDRDVRRRAPDFQVVVGFVGRADTMDASSTKAALLSEVAHRLLWLYQQCLPEVSGEAKFDLGKLLGSIDPNVAARSVNVDGEGNELKMSVDKLQSLKQIHVMRLLSESEQFKASWSGKAGSSKHTSLFILLKSAALARAYSSGSVAVITELLNRILDNSIAFRQSHDEVTIWISCLPTILRVAQGSESPDGAALTDEIEAVVTFLDECVQRCVKTPYRYIDHLRDLSKEIQDSEMDVDSQRTTLQDDVALPSPLIMTVLEQLKIKVTQKLLTPSDVLGITVYLKKLLFRLSLATTDKHNLAILLEVTGRIGQVFSTEMYPEYPVISKAIWSQSQSIRSLILGLPVTDNGLTSEESVGLFLDDVEKVTVSASEKAKMIAAFELVDWLRLLDQSLQADDVRRIAKLVKNLYPLALSELVWALPLNRSLLWDGMLQSATDVVLPFELLFRHASAKELGSLECRDLLRTSLYTNGHQPSSTDWMKAILLISRALAAPPDTANMELAASLLLLLQSVLVGLVDVGTSKSLEIKRSVFSENSELRAWFTANSPSVSKEVYEVLSNLTRSNLNASSDDERIIASDVANFWTDALKNDTFVENAQPLAFAWIQYASIEATFVVFDAIASRHSHNSALLDATLDTLLCSKSRPQFETELHTRMEVLISLPSSNAKDQLLEVALQVLSPPAIDGLPVDLSEEGIVEKAEKQWNRCRTSRYSLDTHLISYENPAIMRHALYNSSLAAHEKVVYTWLKEQGASASLQDLSRVCYPYLDRRRCLSTTNSPREDLLVPHLARFVKGSMGASEHINTRRACSGCVSILLEGPSNLEDSFSQALEDIPLASPITPELMDIAFSSSTPTGGVRDVIVNRALQWVVRVLTSKEELHAETIAVMFQLEKAVELSNTIKPHIAEPVLIAVVQDRLVNIPSLQLLQAALKKVNFKPLIVNRHLQGMIQNPQFHKTCRDGGSDLRDALITVLHTLFHLHPSNTCQTSHVEPLASVYRGTLSFSDQKLLEIFRLFEREKKISVASLLARWSPSQSESSGVLDGLKNIDATMALKTCLRWPRWRRYIENWEDDNTKEAEEDLYDPIFLILFVAHAFSADPPKSTVDWVEVLRTNVVGLLIRALSSKDEPIRRIAATQIATIWKALEHGDMLEKPHVVHVLSLLRDALARDSSSSAVEDQRLPSHITLLLVHALRGIFYPSNFIYPLTARFLLQRPQLDTSDVPMLYSMLYSSNAEDGQWKKERIWMLKFLADGLQGTADWKVFKRRHAWELIASMFSAERDRMTRRGVLEVLANLTCISQATTSLLLKSSLLSWTEIQLLETGSSGSVKTKQEQEQQKHENIAWIKILENILVFANQEKMETVTQGEWRVTILRCLSRILSWVAANPEIGQEPSLAMLHIVSRVILRLTEQSRLREEMTHVLQELLTQGVSILRSAEKTALEGLHRSATRHELRPSAPHCSTRLFDAEASASHIGDHETAQPSRWLEVVEELWRVSMALPTRSEWDALTCRMLIARSSGQVVPSSFEWARKEVVRNMCS